LQNATFFLQTGFSCKLGRHRPLTGLADRQVGRGVKLSPDQLVADGGEEGGECSTDR